ncbi:MAG: lysine--tRNA ligase [Firmicutes bacterium]|nr:lysine--tRNA ligase [Bacillota bacterium]
MHWAERIADEIIRKKPDKEQYVCAAGISPSGSIHIGNFRDIATALFVCKALIKKGKKAKLLFSWDEFDRFRKVPKNVQDVDPEGKFEAYIGQPYTSVPNPFDTEHENYAKYFEAEFMEQMERFGIEMDYRYQTEMYTSGKYKDDVIEAISKRKEIFDILDSFRTQDAEEGERDAYFPVSIFCPVCGKDTTKINSISDDNTVAEYECECGHTGTFDFKTDFNCKLAWKVDWPMRWRYEGVDFEPAGKDHASPGGSYDNSGVISKKIFNYETPTYQGYEFIGIKGVAGKMSGSSGLNLTPGTLLNIYEPEIILWLYSKTDPKKAFDFCFDDGILRQYFEFDKMYNDYKAGKTNEHNTSVMEYCLIEGREIKTVPMSLLVQLGSIVDFNVPMMETVFEKIGTPYKYEDFAQRLELAKYWLYQCAPESANKLRDYRDFDLYNTFSEEEKKEIALLYDYIAAGEYDLDSLNTKLYDIPKEVFGYDVENLKQIQGQFFKNVYKLLISKERGPRLYLFLYAIDRERFMHLLDFSHPQTEEELAIIKAEAEAEAAANAPKVREYGEPDEVKPIVEPNINVDQFFAMDLRVCKIIKCQEIRKAHSNYKLTLFDGLKERVIVSSIKADYTPEELIGKKIIVVANLEPARLTGVTSEGMLLAGTNNACGCQVIFVDDIVPEGTRIC